MYALINVTKQHEAKMVLNSVEQFENVILGNIEGLDQGVALLSVMTDEQYCMRAKPYIESSIGEHLRHILDLYLAVQQSSEDSHVDYDIRRRGALVEVCRETGLKELNAIKSWLVGLSHDMAHEPITVMTEVSVVDTLVAKVPSTLLRELIFVSAHAIHHYALMTISARLCDFHTPRDLGIAPATLSSLRGDSTCVQ